MKIIQSFICVISLCTCSAFGQKAKAPVEYVTPNIGGIGQLLSGTIPYVQYPFGMARLYPVVEPEVSDRYLSDKIYGFPAGPAVLMASTGSAGAGGAAYSMFDHDDEIATPYYYEADLESTGVKAELTPTREAAFYRFTFPATPHARLSLSLGRDASIEIVGDKIVQGSQHVGNAIAGTKPLGDATEYFFVEFSRHLANSKTWKGNALSSSKAQTGDSIGFLSDMEVRDGESIEVKVGISYISTEQARRNVEREIPGWDFNATKMKARAVWNQALSAIQVTGGSERQRTIFYTALYRSLLRMTDITEDGRYFSGYDQSVHSSDGHDFYIDDGTWDTFRSLHPLQLLLDSSRQEDMARSYIRMYEQSGWMPSFPSVAGEQPVMIGHHAAEVILDLYEKGYRNYDVARAYDGIRKNATQATLLPWSRSPLTSLDKIYFERGFFPALANGVDESASEVTPERRQAVSVTIESSYDDWCVAELAKALGKTEDSAYFSRLAQNYRNVYNPAIGFMAPKSADGAWVEPFDPKLGGGQGGRDYFTEVNSWLYTFGVQHDVAGMIDLMGGRDKFNAKLDQLFDEQYGTAKYVFLNQFPDATGLIGQYAQGNEPSFHIPYLYNFSGQPWKAQMRVRQIMDLWYGDGPLGIPGDEDGGAMSSWYVLSAMGFYPATPGVPVYEIGSPIFQKTVLRMGNGKELSIIAKGVSARNKYIQAAQLNGHRLERPWFRHAEIVNGGTLVLVMGNKPNKSWGSSESDAPPSTNSESVATAASK